MKKKKISKKEIRAAGKIIYDIYSKYLHHLRIVPNEELKDYMMRK